MKAVGVGSSVALALVVALGCEGQSGTVGQGGVGAAGGAGAAAAGGAGVGAMGGAGGGDVCSGDVGLVRPLPECTAALPCARIAAELPQVAIETPSEPPACQDPRWGETFSTVVNGTLREACVYRPPLASNLARRPLVVWFHPGGEGADSIDTETSLLDKAEGFDLTGDSTRSGFILAVPQGRNLHFPTLAPRDGRHHDFYHRDLASPSGNPDVAFADALIDTLVEEGTVDPDRVYIMGWSNGGFFGQMYAIARHETPTPGRGARVAAAAVFATADPFHGVRWDPFADVPYDGSPSCQLTTYPASSVPILLTHRTCDVATPCGDSDDACFEAEPGYSTSTWLAKARAAGVSNITQRLIKGLELGVAASDELADSCTDITATCSLETCTEAISSPACLCLVNHLRWPDGQYQNGTGIDHEPAMLEFLRAHPLP